MPTIHIRIKLLLTLYYLMLCQTFFLPALSLFPGDTPAHEDTCLSVGKTDISVPSSAIITAAAVWPTPGIESNSSMSCRWGYKHCLSLIHISEPTRRTPISY